MIENVNIKRQLDDWKDKTIISKIKKHIVQMYKCQCIEITVSRVKR